MVTASLSELKDDIKLMLVHRFLKRNYPFPQVFFTDECCDDRILFQDIFQELEEAGIDIQCSIVTPSSSDHVILEPYVPPGNLTRSLTHKAQLSLLIQEMANKAIEEKNYHISLDIEYDCAFMVQHGIPIPPCLLQIEAFGKIILWQCATYVDGRYVLNMPKVLLEFLRNKSYTFFGSNINSDVKRLRTHCMCAV